VQLFIDSANLAEIEDICRWGVISGVTTNPSLMAKEKQDMAAVAETISRLVDGPISVEVLSGDAPGMLREAAAYAAIHSNITIKVPVTAAGLSVIHQLRRQHIPTNATLVFSANQALLAARAGASFVSPFIGRLDDSGQSGLEVLREIVDIFRLHQIATQVIAASIRSPRQVSEIARAGSHIATVPYAVLQQMVRHPMTEIGIEKFNRDWAGKNSTVI
jgi:transaldolase